MYIHLNDANVRLIYVHLNDACVNTSKEPQILESNILWHVYNRVNRAKPDSTYFFVQGFDNCLITKYRRAIIMDGASLAQPQRIYPFKFYRKRGLMVLLK